MQTSKRSSMLSTNPYDQRVPEVLNLSRSCYTRIGGMQDSGYAGCWFIFPGRRRCQVYLKYLTDPFGVSLRQGRTASNLNIESVYLTIT